MARKRQGQIVVIKPKKKGQKPLKFKKGALTRMAARYGMTPREFCESSVGDSPLKRKRCTFAFKGALAAGRETLRRRARARKKKK